MLNKRNVSFSIVVPIYNVAEYLPRCVESLVNQEYDCELFEVLLVDDGSLDESGKMCDEYEEKYRNVKAYHKKNGGLSDARNYGLSKANKEYVFFIDSDDYVSKTMCSEFASEICKYSERIDMAEGYGINHYSDTDIEVNNIGMIPGIYTNHKFIQYAFLRKFSISACRVVYNREFLQENNLTFKVGIHHEDLEFTPRALLCADHVLSTDICFYHYVIRDNSITQNNANVLFNAKCTFDICKELDRYYDEHCEDEKSLKLLKAYSSKILFKTIESNGLYKKDNRHYIDNELIKRGCFFRKEMIRYKLLSISPYLFHLSQKSAFIVSRIKNKNPHI